MKKIILVILAFVMALSATTSIYAATINDDVLVPYWNYMSSITLSMSFSSNTGIVSVNVTRYPGITSKIEGTLTIYEKVNGNWISIDSNDYSSSGNLSFDYDFPAKSGVTYKAELDVTSYGKDGHNETASTEKIKTCP